MTAARKTQFPSKGYDSPLTLRNLQDEQQAAQSVLGAILFFFFILILNSASRSGRLTVTRMEDEMTVTERVQAAMQPFEAEGLVSRLEVKPGPWGIPEHTAWMPYDAWTSWETNPLYARIMDLEVELNEVIDFGVNREQPHVQRS